MATILEVKGNDINIEVEKLSMSLTKLGCRRTGLEDTIKWLSSNIPECKTTILPNAVSYNFGDRRYLKILNPYLIQYRDSGDNMISGLIKL